MNSKDIRQKYLDFFKSKGHQIVPSAPIVNKNDPTLMFTNAGMNQFKDLFLGNQTPKYPRVADTQKCLRVSGKHNDLEEVGMDTYHHTMFEMLGNWSFGNYFKEDAIAWAWELLTEVYQLPKDRMYVTVFGGDSSENLSRDEEAFNFWAKWINPERILDGSKKDNFWEMGDQGPCGPCSEIHIDLRSDEEVAKLPGKDLVNNDHPLVVEIWNLVFIQFNRKADSSLESLPEKHIDTGMGFERLCMAIQKKESSYDTDVFQPLINFIENYSGKRYGEALTSDIAMRVLSDHIRAISFCIADGQLPSNNKAGYVIRRILRRAVRYAYTFLDIKEPFLHKLVDILSGQFEQVFPELKAQQDFVTRVILEEELSFLRTLETGLRKLEQITSDKSTKMIDGKVVFELYDTFGFPLDLTALIARENGMEIDEEGFHKEMAIQKDRSRKAAEVTLSDWQDLNTADGVDFIGYDKSSTTCHIVKYRKVNEKNKEFYQIVLDQTPFYAESGGQVGDIGYLIVGEEKIRVFDTKKDNELIIHVTDKLPQNPEASVFAEIDYSRRSLIEKNHSATHLLHAALKEVLGSHVNQKGSLVNEKVLRFDFSHFSKVTEEELAQVEKIVNQKIRENIQLNERRNVPIQDAKDLGATALFGEKYGDFVRIITFDSNYSVELCGGTHVTNTGQIGSFRIVSESSVAAGVRRIEAITSIEAENFVNSELTILSGVKDLLKNPKDVLKSLEGLIEEKADLQKQLESLQAQKGQNLKNNLLFSIEKIEHINYIIEKVEIDSAEVLKNISFEIKAQIDNLFMVLAADIAGKPQITVMIAENLVAEKKLNAASIVKDLAKEINGGGGGQDFYATAGGKDLSGLEKVVSSAKKITNEFA
jgi:alanyl-tRNA synthetase